MDNEWLSRFRIQGLYFVPIVSIDSDFVVNDYMVQKKSVGITCARTRSACVASVSDFERMEYGPFSGKGKYSPLYKDSPWR